jgi:hypothetical protein
VRCKSDCSGGDELECSIFKWFSFCSKFLKVTRFKAFFSFFLFSYGVDVCVVWVCVWCVWVEVPVCDEVMLSTRKIGFYPRELALFRMSLINIMR